MPLCKGEKVGGHISNRQIWPHLPTAGMWACCCHDIRPHSDSIGIEVVSKFWPSEKSFEKPTSEQSKSLKWLVEIIAAEYNLNVVRNDVYAHDAIARKEITEDPKCSSIFSKDQVSCSNSVYAGTLFNILPGGAG